MKITINNCTDVFKAKQSSVETMTLKGYKELKTFFVDNSGFGRDDELALTADSFEQQLKTFLTEYNKPVTAKITGVGQFQVYVTLFEKTGEKMTEKIGNNTYFVKYPDSKAIRLHDTNILTEKNGKITINSGGYQTRTTKDRINKYLPNGVYIQQKNYDWYLYDNDKKLDFVDGITIKGYL